MTKKRKPKKKRKLAHKHCAVCGETIHQREDEYPYEFAKRQTCSRQCSYRLIRIKRRGTRGPDEMPKALLRHWYPLNPNTAATARILDEDVNTVLDWALAANVAFGNANTQGYMQIKNCLEAEAAYEKSKFNYAGRKIDQGIR